MVCKLAAILANSVKTKGDCNGYGDPNPYSERPVSEKKSEEESEGQSGSQTSEQRGELIGALLPPSLFVTFGMLGHLSTSPKTGSRVAILMTISAKRPPKQAGSRLCRLIRLGTRTLTR